MAKIRIVTDSTADIPRTMQEGLTIVPLKVHFGEKTYLDGITIQADEFYDKLTKSEQLPTTSQPSPQEFVNAYRQIQEEAGDDVHILSFHLSSSLSGTFQSAKLAQDMLAEEIDITVIDTKKASYGIGMLVAQVQEAINLGRSKEECIALAEQLIDNIATFFMVDTLEYLQKGGRIGRASAVLGSLLNIKPILSLNEEGVVYPLDKVRGSKKAIKRIIQAIREFTEGYDLQLAICHAQAIEQAEELKRNLIEEFSVENVLLTDIGPVIGTHVGPKTLGVIAHRVKR